MWFSPNAFYTQLTSTGSWLQLLSRCPDISQGSPKNDKHFLVKSPMIYTCFLVYFVEKMCKRGENMEGVVFVRVCNHDDKPSCFNFYNVRAVKAPTMQNRINEIRRKFNVCAHKIVPYKKCSTFIKPKLAVNTSGISIR